MDPTVLLLKREERKRKKEEPQIEISEEKLHLRFVTSHMSENGPRLGSVVFFCSYQLTYCFLYSIDLICLRVPCSINKSNNFLIFVLLYFYFIFIFLVFSILQVGTQQKSLYRESETGTIVPRFLKSNGIDLVINIIKICIVFFLSLL